MRELKLPVTLEQLHGTGRIEYIDRAFAEMLDRRLGGIDPWVILAAALVSRAAASGDVCLDLAVSAREGFQAMDSTEPLALMIDLESWIEKLASSPAVGTAYDQEPLILSGDRLYLQRYWQYEQTVAQEILYRCSFQREDPALAVKTDAGEMADHFEGDDDQGKAIRTALTKRFAVISGGPGTGKTYTIARIILELRHIFDQSNLRILLAGPTGKAAARLQDALDQAFEGIYAGDQQQTMTVPAAQTIHRMLGAIPGKTRFKFNAENKLPADAVIVDEASMIDLALMAKLIQAVPADARLILVGDKDQLASVEAGAVLGDICAGLMDQSFKPISSGKKEPIGGGNRHHGNGLSNHIVVLRKNYRFDANSGIDALGAAVNAGDAQQALGLLEDSAKKDIALKSFTTAKDMKNALEHLVMNKIAPAFEIPDAEMALKQINTTKLLAPLRKGPQGVNTLNQWVEQILFRQGVIERNHAFGTQWYPGRPVMITANDYHHSLFNGDMGIAMHPSADHSQPLQVHFPDSVTGPISLTPEQLSAYETVYAMTVHKSQGTEFEAVILVLPDMDFPLLTRELVYTAITRARHHVEIWGRADLLVKATARRIRRASGLRHALWP